MARRTFSTKELAQDAVHLHTALSNGTAFACVLIGVSSVEQALGTLLEKYFVEGNGTGNKRDAIAKSRDCILHGHMGALSSLYSRTQTAFALGLIPEVVLGNLSLLGEIRNKFAHSHRSKDFDDPEIIEKCNKLKIPKDVDLTKFCKTPRARFCTAVVKVFNFVWWTAFNTQHREPCPAGF
jgi:DNA-binding MltR family transcriptional regulator